LIKTYGIHIYNNWFSKLIPVINEDAKTIVLKAPNLFIQQWVETNYGEGIRNIIKKLGLELKELFSSSELKRGY
jgi:chromosomal replication initiation ATPase DnaA